MRDKKLLLELMMAERAEARGSARATKRLELLEKKILLEKLMTDAAAARGSSSAKQRMQSMAFEVV